jgi:hypothetical protein
MTPADLDAVFAEELPTGLFGGTRPRPRIEERPIDPRAAEHVADLMAALDAHDAGLRDTRLRLVLGEAAA